MLTFSNGFGKKWFIHLSILTVLISAGLLTACSPAKKSVEPAPVPAEKSVESTTVTEASTIKVSQLYDEFEGIDVYSFVVSAPEGTHINMGNATNSPFRMGKDSFTVIFTARVIHKAEEENDVARWGVEYSFYSKHGSIRAFKPIRTDRDLRPVHRDVEHYINNVKTGEFELRKDEPFRLATLFKRDLNMTIQ